MGGMRRASLIIVLILIAALSSYSQQKEGEASPFKFGFSIGIGTNTFPEGGVNTTYQSLGLYPDIALGKFGLGLDLTLNYTFTGGADNDTFYVRKEDWVPDGDNSVLDIYLPKLKYIRYGLKGDPLYAKLGSIDDATLGNGFIMGNYANTLFLPEKRIFGLSLDLDGSLFQLPLLGIETFVGNLARFDVLGVRPFIRPLVHTEIPLLKELQLGATLALDRDPGLYAGASGTEAVILYGADFRLPLVNNPAFTLATFGDLAFLHQESLGGMVGCGGRLVKFLIYGAQLRILGENFVPTYFDASYDLFRYEKYLIAKGAAEIPGFTSWLATLGAALFGDKLIFTASLDAPFSKPEPDNENNYLNYPHLYAVLMLQQGIIPNVSLEASYDKRLIRELADLIDPKDAVIGARLNYSIGVAVLSFLYNIRYRPNPAPGEDSWIVTSGIQSTIQLY